MTTSGRSLSLYAAANCEAATETRCRCRCRGKAHGLKRTASAEQILDNGPLEAEARAVLESLPENDPHHIPTREQLEDAARRRRRRPRWVQTTIPEWARGPR